MRESALMNMSRMNSQCWTSSGFSPSPSVRMKLCCSTANTVRATTDTGLRNLRISTWQDHGTLSPGLFLGLSLVIGAMIR